MTYLHKRNWAGIAFLTPYGLSFLCFIVLPLVVALALAFMQFDLTSPGSIKFVGLKNFADALHDPYFWSAFKATMSYVVLMVPGLLVTALGLALGMNAMSRGRNTIRALVFLPGMFNVAVTAIIWGWMYNGEFGLFNYLLKNLGLGTIPWLSDKGHAMPSIVIMSLWWSMGGACIILLTALQQVPRQIFEAAALDGASGKSLFFQITLPSLRPVLLFVFVTTTIAGFQMFGQAFLLTKGGPELATRGLVQYIYETAFNNYRLGYGSAMSWLLFLVIGVFLLLQFLLISRRGAEA